MEGGKRAIIPGLADEKEYPAELTADFELLECFSSSGEAETILVRRKADGARFVAKCYYPESILYGYAEPEEIRRLDLAPMPRFEREIRSENMRCVLREYVEGDTLAAVAGGRREQGEESPARWKFSEEEILGIGEDLCSQLSLLHSQKPPVIHRDITPKNVVIRPDRRAVLIDFGISRVQHEKAEDTVILGTQSFAPPEQYGFARTDARSDIYSLGVLLNWMRCGRAEALHTGDSPLERVIRRCTAFDPDKRYPDAERVQRALENVRKGGSRRLYAAGVCLLAAAAVLAGVFFIRTRREPAVAFSEPMIEQAVRLNLGLSEKARIRRKQLAEVTAVCAAADRACPDEDAFYSAVNQWYADGKISRGSIASLEDLAMLPGLEKVCLAAQEITDISVLAGLENLNKVELKHNQIEDISALAGMKQLTYVGINDNPVQDISPMTECPNLAFLDLCDVRSYDASVTARLGNFDYLDLSNPTDSYRYLAGKSVLSLRLAWTGLSDLRDLEQVDRLEDLDISHTDVTDLSLLADHPGLKRLSIAGVPAQDLSVLKELPQLEQVVVSEEMLPLAEKLDIKGVTVKTE